MNIGPADVGLRIRPKAEAETCGHSWGGCEKCARLAGCLRGQSWLSAFDTPRLLAWGLCLEGAQVAPFTALEVAA